MLKTIKTLAVIAALIITGTTITAANAAGGSHMPTRGKTSQPIGHALFCQQYPQECGIRSKSTKAPKLTRKRWSDIVKVNNRINATVKPVTDQDYYGVEEHWTYPKQYGDCEDYVLLKRYKLLQKGWPESSLLITVVKQPNGDGHAVLTVRTDRADYVLDNLNGKIKPWNKTPYKYLKRQSAKNTGKWTKIKDRRREVASF